MGEAGDLMQKVHGPLSRYFRLEKVLLKLVNENVFELGRK